MRALRAALLGSLVPSAACAATIDWDSLRGTGQGGYAQIVQADRPVLYYRLDDAAHATFAKNEVPGAPSADVGGTVAFQQPGLISNDANHAASFDGTTGSLTVAGGDYDFNDDHPFSLEVWMQPEDSAIAKGDYVRVFSDEQNPGNFPVWDGYIIDMEPTLGISLTLFHGGSSCGATYPTLPVGKTHVVGVFDGMQATLYVNGNPYGTSACTLGITQTAHLVIGASTVGGPWFPGILDEVAVYDYPLTQAQVTRHYDAGK